MKLLGVVITYYPDIDELKENISAYIKNVDKLIIWENTPLKDRHNYQISLPFYKDKIIYKSTEKNEGISYPLNRAIDYGLSNGYTHLLTMDQDSLWKDFSCYVKYVEKYTSMGWAFSPNINNMHKCDLEFINVSTSITSGSIYNLSDLQKLGYFREDYFIDAVDMEICCRAKKNGLGQVICFPKVHLRQEFGKTSIKMGLSTPNYPAIRTFYILRNHIWLWREYPRELDKNVKEYVIRSYLLRRIVTIVLYENNKIDKLEAIFKGVYHGLFRKVSDCANILPNNRQK